MCQSIIIGPFVIFVDPVAAAIAAIATSVRMKGREVWGIVYALPTRWLNTPLVPKTFCQNPTKDIDLIDILTVWRAPGKAIKRMRVPLQVMSAGHDVERPAHRKRSRIHHTFVVKSSDNLFIWARMFGQMKTRPNEVLLPSQFAKANFAIMTELTHTRRLIIN